MVETKKYNFEIKTISPVHIGSGDKYDASEYFLDRHNNKTKVFRRIDIPKYYSSLKKEEQEDFIRKIQKTGYRFPKLNNKKFTRYLSLNLASSRPSPKYQIMENVKSMNKAYIPGSSIKGAIENVIFYNSLERGDIPNLFNGNKINENFIDSFFSPSGNAYDSILRFLQISDSSSAVSPVIYDVFSVKPKKKGVGHENVIKTYLETIYSNKNTLSSKITTSYDDELYDDLGIDDKYYMIDIDYIKESIYNFSSDYIDYEIDFCLEHDYDNLLVFYKNLKKMNSIEKPLLKIGHGSGFLATTISLKIKKFDNLGLYRVVKNNTSIRKVVKKSKKDFPITRKIIKQPLKGNNYREKTIGWCQLIFE